MNDPYRRYAWLRRHEPVHRTASGAWLVTRHADVHALLGRPDLALDRERFLPDDALPRPDLRPMLTRHLLSSDPPRHSRLRSMLAPALSRARAQTWRPYAAHVARTLAARWDRGAPVDLVEAYAARIPVQILCRLIGLPARHWPAIRGWLAAAADPSAMGGPVFEEAMADMDHYIRDMIRFTRRRARAGLLSEMVVRAGRDATVTEDDLTASVYLMLHAGHETTAALIGIAALLLLLHPEQCDRLRSGSVAIPAAVEEVLRHGTPVTTASPRYPTRGLTVAGVTVPAGDAVVLGLASAGRDLPGVTDPERFDIGRGNSRHLAFGRGAHYCPGASLARLQCEAAIGCLLAYGPSPRLLVEPDALVWRGGPAFRELTALPVTFS